MKKVMVYKMKKKSGAIKTEATKNLLPLAL
jgi:hypothetical protein